MVSTVTVEGYETVSDTEVAERFATLLERRNLGGGAS
jgi:hypothetical protein